MSLVIEPCWQNLHFLSVDAKRVWAGSCLIIHSNDVFLLMTSIGLVKLFRFLVQAGSLQLPCFRIISARMSTNHGNNSMHSLFLDNFPSLFPQGKTQYELGMGSQGSENAGKYTAYASGN